MKYSFVHILSINYHYHWSPSGHGFATREHLKQQLVWFAMQIKADGAELTKACLPGGHEKILALSSSKPTNERSQLVMFM
jgi:hypothetical protein